MDGRSMLVPLLGMLALASPPDINYERLIERLIYADPRPKSDPHLELLVGVARAIPLATIDTAAAPQSMYRFVNYHPGNLAPASIFVPGTLNIKPEFLDKSKDDPLHPDLISAGGGYDDITMSSEDYYRGWLLPRSVPEYQRLKLARKDRSVKPLPLVFRSVADQTEAGEVIKKAQEERRKAVAALAPWEELPIQKPASIDLLQEADPCQLTELRVVKVIDDQSFLSAYQNTWLVVFGASTTHLRPTDYAYFGPRAYFSLTHHGSVTMPDGKVKAVRHFKPIDTARVQTTLRTTDRPTPRPAARWDDSYAAGYESAKREARRRVEEETAATAAFPAFLAPTWIVRGQGPVFVQGHYRGGNYVQPYYRSLPNTSRR